MLPGKKFGTYFGKMLLIGGGHLLFAKVHMLSRIGKKEVKHYSLMVRVMVW